MNAMAKPTIYDFTGRKVVKTKLPRRTKFRPTRNSAVRSVEITDDIRALYATK